MAIYKIHKNNDYTVMSNFHLKDSKLSLKAKGLLSVMLSLPENWDYSVRGLESICKETKDTINSILHELEENNYFTRKRIYENGKIVDWEYDIYENNLHPKNLHLKNQDIENQDIGFYDSNILLNNNILNNNIYSNLIKDSSNINTSLNNSNIYTLVDFENQIIKIQEEFNSIESLPKVKLLTNSRKDKLKKRLTEFSIENILLAISKIPNSKFLMGENDNNWKCTFDWLIENDKNIMKIIEGNYESKKNKKGNAFMQSYLDEVEKERKGNEYKGNKTDFIDI